MFLSRGGQGGEIDGSLLIGSIIFLFIGLSMGYIPPDEISEMMNDWKPSAELVQEELTAYRSGWLKQMEKRVATAFFLQTGLFLMWGLWRAGGLMLVGMALFKWGVLTAARSKSFYFGLAAAGLTLGWTLSSFGLVHNFARNWSLDCLFIGSQYNYWGSIPVSLGYLGLVMLICKSDLGGRLLQSISAVGRTALSNYLLQTVLCTTLFYGHGFGLFGSVERTGQGAIVLAVWIVELVGSSWWVKRFRYGPAEWVWRSLAYGKLQPIR